VEGPHFVGRIANWLLEKSGSARDESVPDFVNSRLRQAAEVERSELIRRTAKLTNRARPGGGD
jgi:hypothetical protein